VPKLRSPVASPLGLVTLACAVAALLTPWTVTIPRVNGAEATFGVQSPIAWLAVLALVASVMLVRIDLGLVAMLVTEAILVAWYAWAMWIVTTPAYVHTDFPFVGTDLVGPGWYAAAAGLLSAAASIARRYRDGDFPPGAELWWLSAVPGFALVRLDRMALGLSWAGLIVFLLIVATLASPMAPLFQPLSGFPDLPAAPPTRDGTWVPLLLAVAAALLSIVNTAVLRRRLRRVSTAS